MSSVGGPHLPGTWNNGSGFGKAKLILKIAPSIAIAGMPGFSHLAIFQMETGVYLVQKINMLWGVFLEAASSVLSRNAALARMSCLVMIGSCDAAL